MSHSVGEITDKGIREFLVDMGFVEYESYPGWAYDLAERMVNYGWEKP